jgi:hypothetical protein
VFTDHDLPMVCVVATEAGDRHRQRRLYESARRRERSIDGSVAVTTALLSGGDTDDALTVVAEQARRLADSDAGIVLLPEEEGGLEVVAVSPNALPLRWASSSGPRARWSSGCWPASRCSSRTRPPTRA